MREFLKSPLVQTLKLWETLEPKMTKEAEIIAENSNKVFTYDQFDEPLDWNIDDVMCYQHLLSLVPLFLSVMTPADEDYEDNYASTTILDIGCSFGFLAPFCEHLHFNYVGVDNDTIGEEKSKYSEHIRFKQNDPNAQFVRYLEGDIQDIDGEWARAHDIDPARTFVLCTYCPACKNNGEIGQNIKARLAHEFKQCLIL